jgi:uncharacterized protein YjiK
MYWDAQKKAIMAWRERNPEKFKEYSRDYQQKHYIKKKEIIQIQQKKRYLFNSQARIFRNILIDP